MLKCCIHSKCWIWSRAHGSSMCLFSYLWKSKEKTYLTCSSRMANKPFNSSTWNLTLCLLKLFFLEANIHMFVCDAYILFYIYIQTERERERENLPMMLLPPFDGWPHPLCAVNVPTQNKRRGVKTCRQLGDRIWLFSDRKSLCGKRSPNHLSNKLGWAMQSENPS